MRYAVLLLFFMVATAFGQGGQVVDVSGSILKIDTEKKTILVGSNTYEITSSSVLIVNGARGTIGDLTVGMKVAGSVETPHSSAGKGTARVVTDQFGRKMMQQSAPANAYSTVRMLNANTDPTYVAPTPNPSAGGMHPGFAGRMMGYGNAGASGWPPPSSLGKEAQDELVKKLAGTFWTMDHQIRVMVEATPPPARPNPRAMPGGAPYPVYPQRSYRFETKTQWFSLNADGTTTCEWNDRPGRWAVTSDREIALDFGEFGPTHLKFDPGFSSATFSDNPPSQDEKPPVRAFGEPSDAMLAKLPAGAIPTPVPASPEIQAKASDAIQAYHDSLVFVTGKEGAGSGFIATMSGTTYLVTNAHVAAGISNADFKTLAGTVVKGDAASVAVGIDALRMALPNSKAKPFEIMQGVDQQAAIGDDVVVLGNAGGSGVISPIMGRITGIGPQLVEVDAKFIPGNSGSPIIHLKTGKVIGVATYTRTKRYDPDSNQRVAPTTTRFGYRLDSVSNWQPVNWQLFYNEAAAMERIRTFTKDLDLFFDDISENNGKVTVEKHSNPAIKNRITQWLEAKNKHMSDFDRQNVNANFISFLKVSCMADITPIQGRLAYDYFQRQLARETETRTEMSKAFESIIRSIKE